MTESVTSGSVGGMARKGCLYPESFLFTGRYLVEGRFPVTPLTPGRADVTLTSAKTVSAL